MRDEELKGKDSLNLGSFFETAKDMLENKIARCRVVINKKKAPFINYILKKMHEGKFEIHADTLTMPEDGEPRIYIVSHNTAWDVQNMMEIIKTGAFAVVATDDIPLLVKICYWLMGMIPTDRTNPAKYNTARQIDLLSKNGANIIIHPEKTWYLESGGLMRNLNWGAVKSSQRTGVKIKPIIYHRTSDKNFHYKDLPDVTTDIYDNPEKVTEKIYEDMSSEIGELIFFGGIQKSIARSEFDPEKEKEERLQPEVMKYRLNYEYEKSVAMKKKKKYYSPYLKEYKEYITEQEVNPININDCTGEITKKL